MKGRVPLARQTAVSIPMSPKIIRIFRTLRTPGPRHEGNVARRVPLPQGVPGETGEPEQERPQDAGPGEDAHGEASQKDAEDNGFHIRFLGIRMDEKDVIPRHAALVNPGRTARRRRLTALPAHRAAPPLVMGGFIDEASARSAPDNRLPRRASPIPSSGGGSLRAASPSYKSLGRWRGGVWGGEEEALLQKGFLLPSPKLSPIFPSPLFNATGCPCCRGGCRG